MSEKKEYIERQAIRDAIMTDAYEHFSKNLTSTEEDLLEMVDYNICEAPAANVVELVNAKWLEENYTCSNCHRSLDEIMDADSYFSLGFNGTPICPYCGARMGGDK